MRHLDEVPRVCAMCKETLRPGHVITAFIMFDEGKVRSASFGSVICAIAWYLRTLGFTPAGVRPIIQMAYAFIRGEA